VSVDHLMSKRYSAGSYNCAHFVCEAWKSETGEDISKVLHGVLFPPSDRKLNLRDVHRVKLLKKPDSPCIVLMRNRWSTHVGVWLRGKVLHLVEGGGVQYVSLNIASIGFTNVRFFRC
jgi:hypothetical protein